MDRPGVSGRSGCREKRADDGRAGSDGPHNCIFASASSTALPGWPEPVAIDDVRIKVLAAETAARP